MISKQVWNLGPLRQLEQSDLPAERGTGYCVILSNGTRSKTFLCEGEEAARLLRLKDKEIELLLEEK